MADIKSFEDLDAWKIGREVRTKIYSLINALPNTENHNLKSQMRRAAISVTANIAEGYGRFHYQENIQFLRVARGSLYELKDHLIACFDLKYITQKDYHDLEEKILLNIRLIDGLIRHIKSKMNENKKHLYS